jgi:hypothetical protein
MRNVLLARRGFQLLALTVSLIALALALPPDKLLAQCQSLTNACRLPISLPCVGVGNTCTNLTYAGYPNGLACTDPNYPYTAEYYTTNTIAQSWWRCTGQSTGGGACVSSLQTCENISVYLDCSIPPCGYYDLLYCEASQYANVCNP